MRVFVLGATGALGAQLVPRLVAAGHQVTGSTRSREKLTQLSAQRAQAVLVNALDRKALLEVVCDARPEVLVHQLTAIPPRLDLRHFDRDFQATNRLRTEGTDNIVAVAHAAGIRRVIAQSFAGWTYARDGSEVKTEESPFDPAPAPQFRRTLRAIQHLESVVGSDPGIEAIVLRYGAFYGPGTSLGPGGAHIEDLRRRRFPLIGNGAGVWSFIHISDAAAATMAAIERGAPGVYNIVDDDPAPVTEWLPVLAAAVGAPPPRHVPAWLARVLVGEHAVTLMIHNRGASNRKAKRDLTWKPEYGSWKQGFLTGLG